MTKLFRLVGGLPLHVFLVLLIFVKLISLSVALFLLVPDPNHQRPCGRPKLFPTNILADIALYLCPCLFVLHWVPLWPPTPYLQQFGEIHQVGWCYCQSLSHSSSAYPLYFLVDPLLPEWLDFWRVAISVLRFLISSLRFHTDVWSELLSASLVDRWLAYNATWYTRVVFSIIRLVTVARSYAITCARLDHASWNPIIIGPVSSIHGNRNM